MEAKRLPACPSLLGATALTFLVAIASTTACREQAEPGPSPSPSPPAEVVPSPVVSACDMAALREASQQISRRSKSWSPRLGTVPDLTIDAVAAVWTHCAKLPDEAKILLDLAVDHGAMPSLADIARAQGRPAPAVDDDPLDARIPGHSRYHGLGDAARRAAWEWRASICPGYAEMAEELAEAPAADREAIVWDRCLHRYDFVAREQYVATTRETGTVGFALHHWLTEAGVDDAIADELARPLALGGHWRPQGGLLLPVVAVQTKLDDGVVVELGPRSIHIDHREIATIDAAGRIEAELVPSGSGPIVGPLYDLLAEEADKAKQLAEWDGVAWAAPLLLVAHRELPWSTLRPVLASGILAGFRRVALVGLADDPANPLRIVVVHDASASGTPLELGETTTVQALVDAVVAREGPTRLLP
jgi:hypothetical protein